MGLTANRMVETTGARSDRLPLDPKVMPENQVEEIPKILPLISLA